MTIYRSPIPDIKIPDESLFTFLFEGKIDKEIPGTIPAFIDAPTRRTLTRSEFKAACLSLGWGLKNVFAKKLGGVKITRGDTVMIFSPNCFAWPVALFGSIAGGFKTTFANPSYTHEELARRWNSSGAKVIFTASALAPLVVKMLGEEAKKRVIVMGVGDKDSTASGFVHMDDLRSKGGRGSAERFDKSLSAETVYLCYSSGTTGEPKGVELTHKNIIANCLMLQQAFPPTQIEKDVMLGVLPFHHIFGAVMLLPFAVLIGSPVVIMSQPDPEAFFRNIEKYGVTISLILPTMCNAIVHHPATNQYSLKTLRVLMSGGSPLRAPLSKSVHEKLNSVGADAILLQGYGLTEVSPVSHILPHDQTLSKAGSIGVLLPNLEARLVGEDGDVKPGERGELWLHGPTIMKGYLDNPAATKESITVDGWFKTGDFCTCDAEGFYFFEYRTKDLIKYKDYQVSPAKIEEVLMQHPKIRDAVVIGLYSEEEGTELPMAYVVPNRKLQPGEDPMVFSKEIQKWVRSRVANHQYLRGGVVIIDEIPKNGLGKVLRGELHDRAKGLRSGLQMTKV